ncbi:MAG: hypothetical protein HND48_02370 [Chloroflexi bacterium]|nr:hypothetical protein [Chloroflexota bacterium]
MRHLQELRELHRQRDAFLGRQTPARPRLIGLHHVQQVVVARQDIQRQVRAPTLRGKARGGVRELVHIRSERGNLAVDRQFGRGLDVAAVVHANQ